MQEWLGRFSYWLLHDPNAPGLIQAITAIVTAVLTGWLIVVTRRYTRLTKDSVDISGKLAEIAAKQLATSVQPELQISFTSSLFIAGPAHQTLLATMLQILNAGDSPVKIHRVLACVIGPAKPMNLGEIPIPTGRVVLPGASLNTQLQLVTGVTGTLNNGLFPFVVVDCSDLAGTTEHRFRYDANDGLRHAFGFE